MEEVETNIVSGGESPEVAESHEDNEFIEGFAEEFGIELEKTEDPEEPAETKPEAGKETDAAESDAGEPESEPEMISFKEAGKDFSAPKEAVEAFAKAVGRDVASLIDVYQKGCNYDKLNERLSEALKDSEAFEKIALSRNLDKETLRTELLAQLDKAELDGAVARVKAENPGINEETARELAKFRLNEQKPKAEAPKEEKTDSEETTARLREVEMFQAKHPELGTLPNEVIEIWEKTGISLEAAFAGFQNKTRVSELEKEIAEMKRENKLKEQKNYAREHGPGSATTTAGKPAVDEFVEGLFKEY